MWLCAALLSGKCESVVSYAARYETTIQLYSKSFGEIKCPIIWLPSNLYDESLSACDVDKIIVFVTIPDGEVIRIKVDQKAKVMDLMAGIGMKLNWPGLRCG